MQRGLGLGLSWSSDSVVFPTSTAIRLACVCITWCIFVYVSVCVYGSGMDTNLSHLVQRLEAVTNRLEGVAGQGSVSAASTQPAMMDSG